MSRGRLKYSFECQLLTALLICSINVTGDHSRKPTMIDLYVSLGVGCFQGTMIPDILAYINEWSFHLLCKVASCCLVGRFIMTPTKVDQLWCLKGNTILDLRLPKTVCQSTLRTNYETQYSLEDCKKPLGPRQFPGKLPFIELPFFLISSMTMSLSAMPGTRPISSSTKASGSKMAVHANGRAIAAIGPIMGNKTHCLGEEIFEEIHCEVGGRRGFPLNL